MNSSTLLSSDFQDEIPNFVATKSSVYTLPPSTLRPNRARVTGPISEWYKSLNDRFDELGALPIGWDGYSGRPVSLTLAIFAASLIERLFDPSLPPPSLVPGGDGTLQIEWHRNYYDVEIDVLAPNKVVATRFDQLSGNAEEYALDSDFTKLVTWIAELKIDPQRISIGGAVQG